MNTICENRYKASRQAAGFTQEQVIDLIARYHNYPISARSLSAYENGETRPPDDAVFAMMKLYKDPELGWLHLRSASRLAQTLIPEAKMPGNIAEFALNSLKAERESIPLLQNLMNLCLDKLCNESMKEHAKANAEAAVTLRGLIASVFLFLMKVSDDWA